KVQELGYALHIEKDLRKEDILELYLNKVFFGNGCYGVQTASQFYFGKPAKDLSLPEAALIAGLPQAPSRFSPKGRAEQALRRRNHVLDRMTEGGLKGGKPAIMPQQAAEARKAPLGIRTTETQARLETQ